MPGPGPCAARPPLARTVLAGLIPPSQWKRGPNESAPLAAEAHPPPHFDRISNGNQQEWLSEGGNRSAPPPHRWRRHSTVSAPCFYWGGVTLHQLQSRGLSAAKLSPLKVSSLPPCAVHLTAYSWGCKNTHSMNSNLDGAKMKGTSFRNLMPP